MSNTAKKNITDLLTVIAVILALFQTLISNMPIKDNHVVTVLSAGTIALISVVTVWKQRLSIEINNNSLKTTIAVIAIAVVGGINDVINVVHFSENTDQWLRWSITFLLAVLNALSKIFWPTGQTQSKF